MAVGIREHAANCQAYDVRSNNDALHAFHLGSFFSSVPRFLRDMPTLKGIP